MLCSLIYDYLRVPYTWSYAQPFLIRDYATSDLHEVQWNNLAVQLFEMMIIGKGFEDPLVRLSEVRMPDADGQSLW